MAISTIDQAIAGMKTLRTFMKVTTGTMVAGRPISTWKMAGFPVAGTVNASLTGAEHDSTTQGAMVLDSFGAVQGYLARLSAQATIAGSLLLVDRLWAAGGVSVTSTGSQTINSVPFPARDADETTNGNGVMLGLEINTNTSTNAPSISVGYTNSEGASGRTAVNAIPTVASSVANTFYPLALQAGDLGVRSVQSFALSATWTAGAASLVAYRPIAALELGAALTPNAIDILTGGLPKVFNGSCLQFIFFPATTTTSNISGSYQMTAG